MNTHDGTHPTSITISTNGKEHYPKDGPEVGVKGEKVDNQLLHWYEVANKSKTSGECNGKPSYMFDGFTHR